MKVCLLCFFTNSDNLFFFRFFNHLLSIETLISSIGVCAGSGASVLRKAKADLLITGEMSHHDILDFKHNKTTVILCEHTNTERGYLKDSLYQYLLDNFANIQIFIAKSDHDPVRII